MGVAWASPKGTQPIFTGQWSWQAREEDSCSRVARTSLLCRRGSSLASPCLTGVPGGGLQEPLCSSAQDLGARSLHSSLSFSGRNLLRGSPSPLQVHSTCREQLGKKCPLGQYKVSIIPPTGLNSIDSDGKRGGWQQPGVPSCCWEPWQLQSWPPQMGTRSARAT